MAIKEKRCRENNKGGMITSVCMYGKSKLYFSNISLVGAESCPHFHYLGAKSAPGIQKWLHFAPPFF